MEKESCTTYGSGGVTQNNSKSPVNVVNMVTGLKRVIKKWWVESDFKAPNLSLSLRLKGSGCHYSSIYNNTGTKYVKE